jgi:tetratricopeptide (TPR) repeat protein
MKRKDYRNAIPYFEKAVEIKPKFSSAWLNLGICEHQIRQYIVAVTAFQSALTHEKKKTRKSNIHLRLGNALSKLNRNVEAIEAYNNAIQTTTKSYIKGAANFGMGEIYKKNGNSQKAIAHFQAASKDRTWKQSALYELDLLKK